MKQAALRQILAPLVLPEDWHYRALRHQKGEGEEVYTSRHGRPVIIGYLDYNRWLHKRLNATKHRLQRPPGWATDAVLVNPAMGEPPAGIAIHAYTQTVYQGPHRYPRGPFTLYLASRDILNRLGFEIRRGHNRQIGLSDTHWLVLRAKGIDVDLDLEVVHWPEFLGRHPEAPGEQLSLFAQTETGG